MTPRQDPLSRSEFPADAEASGRRTRPSHRCVSSKCEQPRTDSGLTLCSKEVLVVVRPSCLCLERGARSTSGQQTWHYSGRAARDITFLSDLHPLLVHMGRGGYYLGHGQERLVQLVASFQFPCSSHRDQTPLLVSIGKTRSYIFVQRQSH